VISLINEKVTKCLIIVFLSLYIVLGIVNLFVFNSELSGVGQRWIVSINGKTGFMNEVNPMTLIMSFAIMIGLIIFASTVKFRLVPEKKRQTVFELLFEFYWSIVEDAVPNPKYRKPVFILGVSFFLYVLVSNLLGGMPGISVSPLSNGKVSVEMFTDTWYTPTSDLNVNAAYAISVLIISHVFSAHSKGVWKWFKGFFEPIFFLFPLNIVGELAKPISHSVRLFGNIMGGGILVLIVSYMLKYFLIPVFLWGFFGWFVGLIQAFVFSLLAIAYIGSAVE